MFRLAIAAALLASTLAGPVHVLAATDDASIGYDVSYLDCDTALPSTFGFALINVNDGRPFTANPCFASEVSWASAALSQTQPTLSFYINTANPGPRLSLYWPGAGTNVPQVCDGTATDACAYDFGWAAAIDGFGRAADVVGPSVASASEWWLDVETANSWSDDQAANISELLGSVDALRYEGIARVGIYATRAHWAEITGASHFDSPINAPFSGMPNWIPRLGTIEAAEANCTQAQSLTGGPVELVQYEFFLDKNITCPR